MTVLTGFLGAGKTTLLNHVLNGTHGIRFGVLVNDFGDINIDARLVTGIDGGAIDLSNGCVCCTMRGSLVTSIQRVLSRPDPAEHILVEASGIADPFGILAALRTPQVVDRVSVDGVVALVDAENAQNPRFDRQLALDQIRSADIVVLNKADLVTGDRVAELHSWLGELSPGTPVIEAVRARVPLEVLVGLDKTDRSLVAPPDTPGHRLESWVYESSRPLAYRKVRGALEDLTEEILRVKGILYLADAPRMRFAAHRVGRRIEIDVAGPWDSGPASQIVMLGAPGAVDAGLLVDIFDQCATDAFTLMPSCTLDHRSLESLRAGAERL